MINSKQEELLEDFLRQLKERFPEIDFLSVEESWEDPATLWIWVEVPDDDEILFDLFEFSGDVLSDMFLEYGYHMLVMANTSKAA